MIERARAALKRLASTAALRLAGKLYERVLDPIGKKKDTRRRVVFFTVRRWRGVSEKMAFMTV